MEVKITKEQFDNWIDNPVTKEIFSQLKFYRDNSQAYLNAGSFPDGESALLIIGELRGTLRAYDQLLTITYSAEENEEEQKNES